MLPNISNVQLKDNIKKNLIFSGDVDIYLFGKNALMGEDFPKNEIGLYTDFYIANCKEFLLHDYRNIGWNTIEQINVPSFIRIYFWLDENKNENLEIFLDNISSFDIKVNKTLFFGSLYNRELPMYDVVWESFNDSPLADKCLGFVMLINNKEEGE